MGGTTLTGASPTTKGTETAWAGTGSGCSTLEPKPFWQTDTNPTSGCLNRTENDVSAVADPKTGVAIYDTAPSTLGLAPGYNEAGGTSTSTPIITSTYALAGTPTAGTYPSSYPYQHTSAFNKVTSGSNGTCESTRLYLCNAADSLAGYNGPTGEGTPSGVTGFSEATTGNVVTVLNPGTVDIANGVSLTLPIKAVDSASSALSYSAAGLPAGVTINGATGVISGTDTGAPGTASVTVTATDGTSASGSVTFNLATVAPMAASYHPAAGPARLALGGKCLDDTGRSTTNGTQVQIWSCTGASNQTWTLTASPVQSGVSGKCLDDTGNSAANGNKIQIYTCNGEATQKWVLAADGTLRVNGKCLDVTGKSLLDGAKIQLWACTGGSNQQWLVGPNGELINVNSSRCLDDTGGSTVNGTQLDQQDCYGSVPEVWAAT